MLNCCGLNVKKPGQIWLLSKHSVRLSFINAISSGIIVSKFNALSLKTIRLCLFLLYFYFKVDELFDFLLFFDINLIQFMIQNFAIQLTLNNEKLIKKILYFLLDETCWIRTALIHILIIDVSICCLVLAIIILGI